MGGLEEYEIYSNRKRGMGRPDIQLKPYDPFGCLVIIIEVKWTKSYSQMEKGCQEALRQIEERI